MLAFFVWPSLGLYSCLEHFLCNSRRVKSLTPTTVTSEVQSDKTVFTVLISHELLSMATQSGTGVCFIEFTGRSQSKDPIQKSSGRECTQPSLAAHLQASPCTYKQVCQSIRCYHFPSAWMAVYFLFYLRSFLQAHPISLLGHIPQGKQFSMKFLTHKRSTWSLVIQSSSCNGFGVVWVFLTSITSLFDSSLAFNPRVPVLAIMSSSVFHL